MNAFEYILLKINTEVALNDERLCWKLFSYLWKGFNVSSNQCNLCTIV